MSNTEVVANFVQEGAFTASYAECTTSNSYVARSQLHVDQVGAQGIAPLVYLVEVTVVRIDKPAEVGRRVHFHIFHPLRADEIQGDKSSATLKGAVGGGNRQVDLGQRLPFATGVQTTRTSTTEPSSIPPSATASDDDSAGTVPAHSTGGAFVTSFRAWTPPR